MKDSIHVSKENYLKAILEAEAEGREVIPALLAHWLEVSAPAVTMGAVWRSCGSKNSMAPGANVSLKRTLPNCISLMLKNIQHPDSEAAQGSAVNRNDGRRGGMWNGMTIIAGAAGLPPHAGLGSLADENKELS